MRFAYAKHDNRLLPEVIAWLERMVATANPVFALLDGSMLEPARFKVLDGLLRDLEPALAGTPFEVYGQQGPQLWLIESIDPEQLSNLLRYTDGIPCLSFIVGRQSTLQLKGALAWLAKADTGEALPMHCRFADTRMLPSLLESLEPDQSGELARGVIEWAWVGREGRLQRREIAAADPMESPSHNKPFQLDAQQFGLLLQRAEPDMVFQMLADNMSDVLPDQSGDRVYERIARMLANARGYGVVDLPDLFQYVVVGFCTTDDFDRYPTLASTWGNTRGGRQRFGDLAKQWPEETWQALELQRHMTTEASVQ